MPQKGERRPALQDAVKHLYLGLKGIGSYPANHPASVKPVQKAFQLFSTLLKKKNRITIRVAQDTLLVEDTPINRGFDFSFKLISEMLARNVSGVTFTRGLSQQDLKDLLQALSAQPEELCKKGGMAENLRKRGISSIKIKEVHYSRAVGGAAPAKGIQGSDVYEIDDETGKEVVPSDPGYRADDLDGAGGAPPEVPGIDEFILDEDPGTIGDGEEVSLKDDAVDGSNASPRHAEGSLSDGSSGLCLEGSDTPDDITLREVPGSSVPEIDFLARHAVEIKEKLSAYLEAGRIDEARTLLDHYGKRLDDQSWQIRKMVAQGFNAIISGLDELDKVSENFREVSSNLINKLTARLKQEDHIDTYLALTESLRTACSKQEKSDGYYVDETLGHRLYSDARLSRQQLQQVLSTRKTSGRSIQYTVAALNYLNEKEVLQYLSEQFTGYSMLHLTELTNIPNNILETIPSKYAKRYYSLPFKLDDQRLYTALDNPKDMNKISDLEFISGYTIVPFGAAEYFLMNAIDRFYSSQQGPEGGIEQLIEEIRQEEEDGSLEFIEEKEEPSDYVAEYEGTQGPIV
ncbi:MAG: hypothetical protein ACMUIL_05595, partial [bacterium]